MDTAKMYRAKQKIFIYQGRWDKAIEMDIKDIQTKFGNTYNKSINEMLDYAQKKGLIDKKQRSKLKTKHH